MQFLQIDTTETFYDNLQLKPDQWVETIAINARIPNPEESGLPSIDATPEAVYDIAKNLSAIREKIELPNDGVYCPICHIANIDLRKLGTPCHQCGRNLLKFGWD